MPINETIQEQAAKHALEKKLGRKVDVHELYSLGAYMDAADGTPPAAESNAAPAAAPTLPAPTKPMSKATKWVLATCALVVVGAIFLAITGVVFMSRSGTRNAPKPPQGAFPESIAGYRKTSGIDSKDWRTIHGG